MSNNKDQYEMVTNPAPGETQSGVLRSEGMAKLLMALRGLHQAGLAVAEAVKGGDFQVTQDELAFGAGLNLYLSMAMTPGKFATSGMAIGTAAEEFVRVLEIEIGKIVDSETKKGGTVQ